MNTALLMAELHEFIQLHGINIILGKIHTFDELEQEYICNCSGLGAAELLKDKSLVPVQGHLIMLNNQLPENMNYSADCLSYTGVLVGRISCLMFAVQR
jgi:hypothetical protein